MSPGKLTVALLGLVLGSANVGADTPRPVQLPDYNVEGDMPQTRMPRDQMREMRTTVEQRYRTFALENYTVVKYPRSQTKTAVKSLIRDGDGKVVADITNERGVYEISDKYAGLFAASNQPAEQSGLFFLLKIRRDRDDLTLGFLEGLFADYSDFISKRVEFIRQHYQSRGKEEFNELYHLTVPDEIVVIASDEATAAKIAGKLGVKTDGRGIRLSAAQLKELVARLGRNFRVSDDPAAIEGVSPWRHDETLPMTKEHCALIAVGWAVYRPHFFSRYRYELIVPGIMNPPGSKRPAS